MISIWYKGITDRDKFLNRLRLIYRHLNCSLVFLVDRITITAWKKPVLGVFLFHFFPHLDWVQSDTKYLPIFSANAGKCRPEKLQIRILFTQCIFGIFPSVVLLFHYCSGLRYISGCRLILFNIERKSGFLAIAYLPLRWIMTKFVNWNSFKFVPYLLWNIVVALVIVATIFFLILRHRKRHRVSFLHISLFNVFRFG